MIQTTKASNHTFENIWEDNRNTFYELKKCNATKHSDLLLTLSVLA